MQAWLSWTVVLALGGAAYWYYGQNDTRRRHRSRPLQRVTDTASRAKDEAARQWNEVDGPSKGQPKTAKAKAPKKAKKAAQETTDKSEAYLSNASGVDGDDDLSPVTSPTFGATDDVRPSGKDVSDMLEPRAAAASVLRLTPETKPARPKQPQQQRPDTPQENKKARQHRQKADQAKLEREQAEKERQALMEKQRRTAREARGEPAKNGMQPAKAPTTNAWTTGQPKANGGNTAFAPVRDNQLLDTFEPDQMSTASSKENATNGTSTPDSSLANSANWQNLPSEEEQMRLALEDSEWTTVPKGRKAKKTKPTGPGSENGTESSEAGTTQQETPVFKAPTVPAAPKEPARSTSSFALLDDAPTDAKTVHPLDSDWPVV